MSQILNEVQLNCICGDIVAHSEFFEHYDGCQRVFAYDEYRHPGNSIPSSKRSINFKYDREAPFKNT